MTIKGKLVPREVKTKWMNRHFMTRQSVRELHEELRHEARFGRIVSEGEARVEDILAAEKAGNADS